MRDEKPPRKKTRPRQPDAADRNRPMPASPEAADRPEGKSDADQTGKPSEEEVVSNWSKPVTNQDEQDKITNAGEGDIPMANK